MKTRCDKCSIGRSRLFGDVQHHGGDSTPRNGFLLRWLTLTKMVCQLRFWVDCCGAVPFVKSNRYCFDLRSISKCFSCLLCSTVNVDFQRHKVCFQEWQWMAGRIVIDLKLGITGCCEELSPLLAQEWMTVSNSLKIRRNIIFDNFKSIWFENFCVSLSLFNRFVRMRMAFETLVCCLFRCRGRARGSPLPHNLCKCDGGAK